jgi:hypothetical protein
MPDNPFGDDLPTGRSKASPFGDDTAADDPGAAIARVEQAALKIRGLKSQLGAEGLSLPAMRLLIEEVTAALDAVARALRARGAR